MNYEARTYLGHIKNITRCSEESYGSTMTTVFRQILNSSLHTTHFRYKNRSSLRIKHGGKEYAKKNNLQIRIFCKVIC